MFDDDFFALGYNRMGAREIHGDLYNVIGRLKKLGAQHGLQIQVFFLPPPYERYVVFARNGAGLRYHFHETDKLDDRVVDNARFVFFINRNVKKFFRQVKENKRYRKIQEWAAFQDENRAVAREQKRLFQRLGRALGVMPGKTNLPY